MKKVALSFEIVVQKIHRIKVVDLGSYRYLSVAK